MKARPSSLVTGEISARGAYYSEKALDERGSQICELAAKMGPQSSALALNRSVDNTQKYTL